jgi:vWA domain found in the FtsH ternary systems
VLRAEEVLALAIPRRLPRKARKEGSTATHLEDESVYPVGGFSSMSTAGSIENLVTSELIYMNPPGQENDGVDLFDMRYVEGELLYYTRDEAIFVRRRRQIIFAIDAHLVRARVKDPGLPWQRIVLVLAVLVTVTKKLVELLGTEDLDIRVVFIPENGKIPLADEQALTDLLFGEWKDRGIASIAEASWSEIVTMTTEATRRALVEVVHLKILNAPPIVEEFHPAVARVDFPVGASTMDEWSKATTDLVASLL